MKILKADLSTWIAKGLWVLIFIPSLGLCEDVPEKKANYDIAIHEILKHWPPKTPEIQGLKSSIVVQAWSNEQDPYYIGLHKVLVVDAPIDVVDKVLSAFENYQEIFREFKDIHVVSNHDGQQVLYWERSIPIPFVPNIYYRTIYTIDRKNEELRVFNIHLKDSNRVLETDNALVLQSKGPNQTIFTSLSFFKADWGPAKFLGLGRIWRESIEGSCLSDLSVKLRAEHPDWTPDKIEDERRTYLNSDLLDTIYKSREFFDLSKVINVDHGQLKKMSH